MHASHAHPYVPLVLPDELLPTETQSTRSAHIMKAALLRAGLLDLPYMKAHKQNASKSKTLCAGQSTRAPQQPDSLMYKQKAAGSRL